jgi:hypothetical protein
MEKKWCSIEIPFWGDSNFLHDIMKFVRNSGGKLSAFTKGVYREL